MFEYEGYLQHDTILGYLAVFTNDALILFPSALDSFQGFRCTLDALADGVFKTVF